MDAGAVATWVGAAVALIAAAVASVQAGRSNSAARRSATAGERAAAAAERANELAELQAAKYVPRWQFVRLGRMSCQLTNGAEQPAHHVTITREDGSPLWRPLPEADPQTLGFGESMTCTIPTDFYRPGTQVLVTWQLDGETEPRTQRLAVPPL